MSDELIKRGEDLRERCERSCSVTNTAFLTPAEQYALENWAKRAADCRMILRGGVEGAERRAAFFLPFYVGEADFDPSEYIRCIHAKKLCMTADVEYLFRLMNFQYKTLFIF